MNRYEKLAEQYRGVIVKYRQEYPYLSKRKLAQLIVNEENLRHSPEYLRSAISVVGSENDTNIDLSFNEPEIELVRSIYKEREAFVIPKKYQNLLILSDIHVPYHHLDSLKIAIKYGLEHRVDSILLNGDICDFYSISRFDRLPDQRDVNLELEFVRRFLEQLRGYFPDAKIFYKIGNHEDRWDLHLMRKAPELFNVEEMRLEQILHLNKYGIELIGSKTRIEYGKLNIIHGHEIFGGGINVARNFRLKANDNLLFGHFHRHQSDVARTIRDKLMGSFSVGCLCGLSPEYMPINNWSHGFARVERDDDGFYEAHNLKIVNGKIK